MAGGAAVGKAARSGGAADPARSERTDESDRERRRREAREREVLAAATRPLKNEIERLEARIAALESEKADLEPRLADPALYADFQRARPLTLRFDEIRTELEALYARWEEAQGELLRRTSRD
jgi:ATP-binding cassette subfamily F protein 3